MSKKTDPGTELDRSCKIELSEVTVRGEPWWTLAFESIGEGNRAMNLEPFALHFLKMLRWPCPCRARLDGLPEWLSKVVSQSVPIGRITGEPELDSAGEAGRFGFSGS